MNIRDWDDKTPLMVAASCGYGAAVELLLRNGADACAQFRDETALHYATYNGHEAVCRLLLDHRAAVDAKNRRTSTP